MFFLCCLGAGVSFVGSYSFLFFPWEEGEDERGEDTRGMWKLEQREVCSVPRADDPRRARTAASTVVALVPYIATDRLLRTSNLAINIYTLLTSIIYRSSRGNRPDSPVDSPPRPEYRTAEEPQPPVPQHHEEKGAVRVSPDTRSTYKRKRNSVHGWPLERRDRFARNSAHPRS